MNGEHALAEMDCRLRQMKILGNLIIESILIDVLA
jgi:hypothetical protein